MSPSAQSKQIWHDSSGLITLKISRVRKAFQNGTYTRIYMSWWKKSCTTKIPLRTPQVVQVFFHQLYSICYTKKTCQLSIHVYIYIYILFKQDSSWLFDLLRQQKTWRWLPEGSQNSFAMYTEQVYPNCCSKVPLSTQSQDEGIVPYARPPLDGYYVLFCICTCICLQLEGKSQYSPYSANKGQHPRWWKKIHGPRRRFKNPVVGSTFISALGPWPPKNTDPMWVILVTCDMNKIHLVGRHRSRNNYMQNLNIILPHKRDQLPSSCRLGFTTEQIQKVVSRFYCWKILGPK